ncbi:sialoadhesin-like [Pygocentrus nattereri]|uniref:sialoadhesin-like n=1 Tax=Pygocentrus nattereri TaxID=42514 RepID=UPI001891AFDA|nr:sialoadhesin-like [Pygocentrus nattereri]
MCTFHHTSVVLPCKLTHPTGEMVTTSVWHYKKQTDAEPVVVPVVQEFGEHVEDCSLTLNNVTQDNAGIYQFSFTTNISTQNLTNEDGVTLEITDLKVDMVSELGMVLEGKWVKLFCGTCIPSVTLPTYIWHKDGRPHSRIHGVNQLDLQEAKPEDSGSYSCSIGGQEGLLSSPVNFTVEWAPKNVSVSITPSGEIVEGSSVTLTCNSDGNPPVKIYTWFKGSTSVGEGKTYSIPNIRSEDSGEYTCQSRNDHGQRRSTAVYLNVLCMFMNIC